MMRRQILQLFLGSLIGSCALPSALTMQAQAQQFNQPPGQFQEQERAPVANAIGRFFGFGYSAGYHARAESRYGMHRYTPDHNVVPQPERGVPAYTGSYGQYAQAMQHQMMPGQMPGQMPSQMPGQMMGQPMTHSIMSGAASDNLVPAPKPVEPPPSWLKQYIKPDGTKPEAIKPSQADDDSLLNDASPSDRRGVLLSPSPGDSTTSLSITPSQPTQVSGRPVISILQH